MKLDDLLEIPGVLAAWEWEVSDRGRHGFAPAKLARTVGRIPANLAELGMDYLELLGHLAFFECELLDRHSGQRKFSPIDCVALEGSHFTVIVTSNRVAVTLDQAERPDFWRITEAMSAIER
jgi:roadblock/LC7 domain-containing protein